jgi:asparagine synthase (glutamine-hydrolysing)
VPGIFGLVTAAHRVQAQRELDRMREVLCQESLDATATWSDESLGVYVGWFARGTAPATATMREEGRDVVVIFSGEDFSEPGSAGCSVGDPAFPAGLNGRFHGLVVDRRHRAATLFNDRYGLHRLYYHQSRDGFAFATQAKAILALRPELKHIDMRGLGELVSCGSVLENRTLFSGIDVLPAASRWLLRDGAVARRDTYFRPQEWEAQSLLDPESYYRELRQILLHKLPRYLGECGQVGMSLTGGLDTRMIMAGSKPAAGALPCHTFGGISCDSRDVRRAREVAHACGQPHQIIRVDDELLRRFRSYAERTVYLTDGSADVGRAPDLYLNEAVRQIAPVRLTGNHGSEVLRRVTHKPPKVAPAPFCAELVSSMRDAEHRYAALRKPHPLSFVVFQQIPWHYQGLLALEETQVTMRSPFLDNDLVRTAFRAPPSAHGDAIYWRFIGELNPALRSIASDRGAGGYGWRGAMSRLLGEVEIKAEYLCDYGMPHWAAPIDRALGRLSPARFVLGRHKFSHFRSWYRGVLADYVREVLLDPATLRCPFFQRHAVETVVRDHLDGHRNYTVEIHKLLTIELIHRLLV